MSGEFSKKAEQPQKAHSLEVDTLSLSRGVEVSEYLAELIENELQGVLNGNPGNQLRNLLIRSEPDAIQKAAASLINILSNSTDLLDEQQIDAVSPFIDAVQDCQLLEETEELLDLCIERVPENSPLKGRLILEMADLLFLQGENQAALDLYQESSKYFKNAPEEYQLLQLPRLETMAFIYEEEGNYREIENCRSAIYALCCSFPASGHTEILSSLENLAQWHLEEGQTDAAEELMLDLLKRTGQGPDLVEYRARGLTGLADIYEQSGRLVAASDCLRLALKSLEQEFPSNSQEVDLISGVRERYIAMLQRFGDEEELEIQQKKQIN